MPQKAEKPAAPFPPAEPGEILRGNPTDDALPVVQQPTDIMGLLSQAIAQGTAIETIERLEQMHERMIARIAEAAFNVAKAKFHADCPPIVRRSENAQFTVTTDGRQGPSKYAKLDDIAATIREPLGANGLSYSWTDAVITDDMLTLKCVLAHIGGHKEEASATFPLGSLAGSSPQQKYGSTMTYAQRYSLVSALGLTSCDEDDDGAGGTAAHEPIGEDQAKRLRSFMLDVKTDFKAFLAYFEITELAQLPVSRYDEAMRMLNKKLKEQEAQK